jgi:hypothetical protein
MRHAHAHAWICDECGESVVTVGLDRHDRPGVRTMVTITTDGEGPGIVIQPGQIRCLISNLADALRLAEFSHELYEEDRP